MIDKQKFHHTVLTLFHQWRIRAHAHAVDDVLGARNLRARHPVNDRHAVGTKLRLAVGTHFGHTHFDQTHPAIPRRTEFLVITVTRHVTTSLFAGLDQSRALRKLVPHAVDLDVEKWS